MSTFQYLTVLLDVVQRTDVVAPEGEAPPCRDEDDRKYLHVAVHASLEYLITSDNDLLAIGAIGGCRIVTALTFLNESGLGEAG